MVLSIDVNRASNHLDNLYADGQDFIFEEVPDGCIFTQEFRAGCITVFKTDA